MMSLMILKKIQQSCAKCSINFKYFKKFNTEIRRQQISYPSFHECTKSCAARLPGRSKFLQSGTSVRTDEYNIFAKGTISIFNLTELTKYLLQKVLKHPFLKYVTNIHN
jgi:hypothetical protein